jgi:hypothetical protein
VTEEELSQYEEQPMFRPDHMAVGHGLRSGKPCVIFAFVVNGEAQVLSIDPDEADYIAKRMRRAAGATRALQEQEGT